MKRAKAVLGVLLVAVGAAVAVLLAIKGDLTLWSMIVVALFAAPGIYLLIPTEAKQLAELAEDVIDRKHEVGDGSST